MFVGRVYMANEAVSTDHQGARFIYLDEQGEASYKRGKDVVGH